jgi:hypothetical protein
MMGAEAAEALVDEVTLLEAALREAMSRKQGADALGASRTYIGSPMATTPVAVSREPLMNMMNITGLPAVSSISQPAIYGDQATQAYGAQLKAWIDWQVDTRLNALLPSLLARELSSVQQESGAAARMYQRLEGELDLVKSAQAKLFAVVEGLSEEVTQLKVQGEALAAVEKILLTVEELKQSVSSREADDGGISQIRVLYDALRRTHEAGLGDLHVRVDEMRRLHDGLHGRHDAAHTMMEDRFSQLHHLHNELRGLHDGLIQRHGRLDAGVTDLQSALDEFQRRHNSLEDNHHSRFTELQRLFGEEKPYLTQEMQAMKDMRREVTDLVSMVAKHENRLAGWRSDITAVVTDELQLAIEAGKKGNPRDLEDVREDVDRKIKELRAETHAAFRNEAAAVASLDEQLWLTDQRLGQRIDDLARSQRDSLKAARLAAPQDLRVSVTAKDRVETISSASASPLHQRHFTAGSEALRIARRVNVEGGSLAQDGPGLRPTETVASNYRPLREAPREEDEASSEGRLRSNGVLKSIAERRLRSVLDDDARGDRPEVRFGEADAELGGSKEETLTSLARRPLRFHANS